MSYLEHIQQKQPHERRTHALGLSLAIMAVVFLGWLVMLPVRFASLAGQQAAAQQQEVQQTAGAAFSQVGNATLLVATSSGQ